MAQASEGRQQRRNNGNGSLHAHAGHVREDVVTLQKDLSQLRTDIGALIAQQWRALGERVDSGADYVGEQVRERPLASLGVAAGAGLLAGIALASLNGRGRRRH